MELIDFFGSMVEVILTWTLPQALVCGRHLLVFSYRLSSGERQAEKRQKCEAVIKRQTYFLS
jgi:hypothetical protein